MSSESNYNKTIILLMCAQACYLSAMSVDMTITALVGSELAPAAVFATVPMALISIFSVLVAPYIPIISAKIGLKFLFMLGGFIAILGGISSWYSINSKSFVFLCIGTSLVGIYQAIANYYRYAASDISKGNEVRNISLILSSGIVAAIVGPMLATWTSQSFMPIYSGSYLLVSGLGTLALLINSFLPKQMVNKTIIPSKSNPKKSNVKISLFSLLKRASFRNGALLCLCSCFAMALIMSGAPIFMQNMLNSSPDQRMLGMQLHMVGMYLPVIILLFSAKYIGMKVQIMFALIIGVFAVAFSAFSVNHVTVIATLLLIGVFWSFSYSSGSALLTKSYSSEERESARGKGELFPVLGLAIGSLLAGPLNAWIGWATQMIFIFAFIVIVAILLITDWKKI